MPKKHDPDRHHRRSVRLQGYDYSQAGAYFVTICTWGRECLLGQVVDGTMRVNACGQIVEEEWLRTPDICPQVELDAYVVMPNHFHAVLVIVVGAYCNTPLRDLSQTPQIEAIPPSFQSPSQTVGAIVRGFKSAVTKRINLLRQTPGRPVWQRNYYEHVIRDAADCVSIRHYIEGNPALWLVDRENLKV
jgi:putative transposase